MQRQGQVPFLDELVDRRPLGRLDNLRGNPRLAGLGDDLRIVWIEDDIALGRGEFVIILPDTNAKKCIEIVEKINRSVAAMGLKVPTAGAITVCAGISENPIDGVQAEGLYLKAQERMKAALSQGKLLQAFI